MAKVILIVEDDPKSLKLVRDLLEVSGFVTLTATDGKRGVELAREHKPGLVVMDIQMPVMNGLDATRILKADQETRDIRILALTSRAMRGDEEDIVAAGCDGYMTKPIDTRGFLKKVKSFLREEDTTNGQEAEGNGCR